VNQHALLFYMADMAAERRLISYLDVMSRFDVNCSTSSTYLVRAYRRGLARRFKVGRKYRYILTKRGFERVNWMLQAAV